MFIVTDVKMTNYFTKKLKPFWSYARAVGIISVLCSQRATTQKELAKRLIKHQTTVVRMIQSMERKGIVKKDLNEQDRRSHNLF